MKSGNLHYRKLPEWLSKPDHRIIRDLSLGAEWSEGRQKTGYKKYDLMSEEGAQLIIHKALRLIGNPADYDAWLLHFPTGSEIRPHTDPASQDKCHVRLNAIVVAATGGELYLDGQYLPLSDRDAYLFRPDKVLHSVTPVRAMSRFVLSIGANVETSQAEVLGLA